MRSNRYSGSGSTYSPTFPVDIRPVAFSAFVTHTVAGRRELVTPLPCRLVTLQAFDRNFPVLTSIGEYSDCIDWIVIIAEFVANCTDFRCLRISRWLSLPVKQTLMAASVVVLNGLHNGMAGTN